MSGAPSHQSLFPFLEELSVLFSWYRFGFIVLFMLGWGIAMSRTYLYHTNCFFFFFNLSRFIFPIKVTQAQCWKPGKHRKVKRGKQQPSKTPLPETVTESLWRCVLPLLFPVHGSSIAVNMWCIQSCSCFSHFTLIASWAFSHVTANSQTFFFNITCTVFWLQK